MPLNTDPNFPPSGNAPYAINREWCMGDSLGYMNANFDNFDTRINTVSTYATNLSGFLSDNQTATNGFIKLPGNILMQWGTIDFNNSSYWSTGNARRTIAFPRSFSTAPWSVTVTPVIPSGIPTPTFGNVEYDKIGQVSAITNLSADLIIQGSAGSGNNLLAISACYIAIGPV